MTAFLFYQYHKDTSLDNCTIQEVRESFVTFYSGY